MHTFGMILTCALSALACTTSTLDTHRQTQPASPPQTTSPPETFTASQPVTELPVPSPEPGTLHVILSEPQLLSALQTSGFALAPLVLGIEATSTAQLSNTPRFKSLFEVVKADLEQVKEDNPKARVSATAGLRLFNKKWLDSKEMSFELTGVINRLDRRAFYDEESCGEIRFIYRLVYDTTQGDAPMHSRLPMTLNVVFEVDTDNNTCLDVATSWRAPENTSNTALAAWFVEHGALSLKQRTRWTLKSVETNLQTLRWQSTTHPGLAGHVEYFLRVFQPTADDPDTLAPTPLENTPDVARLKKSKESRLALLEYLKEPDVLARIDQGTLTIGPEFLTDRALSTASRGLARLANRPFKQLYKESDFADLDLSGYQTISSPKALLRRLDAASCAGCHQSRSIAGFHHLGEETESGRLYNALHSGTSSHLKGDLKRRHNYVSSLIEGQTPNEYRPFPETQGAGLGTYAPCGLGDPGFDAWTCASGLECTPLEDSEIGLCIEPDGVGNPCEYGTSLKTKSKPHKDRVKKLKEHACSETQACSPNVSAFPQGECSSGCDTHNPDLICAPFPDIDGLQKCLRKGGDYATCTTKYHYESGLVACDDEHPCRPDYVCAKTPDAERGGCIPTYFLYQLRNDGYPLTK